VTNLYVGIMAGGIGSRFWPVSRNHLPKQFLDFLGTGKSLLQMTFVECIQKGLNFAAENDNLLTLGIKPTRPDTGYGYIQFKRKEAAADNIFKVKTFTEKPPLDLAKTFIDSGDFLWNSGIFIWSVQSILSAFEKHMLEVFDIFKTTSGIYNTPKERTFINAAYGLCTNISIDYGIMEKADNVLIMPGDFTWSDLGTWGSLYENMNKDYLGNAVSGKNVMIYDAVNCMVSANDDKLVILSGLKDFCVIDTEDVLLIFKKDQQQEIKQIVSDVKRKKGDQFM